MSVGTISDGTISDGTISDGTITGMHCVSELRNQFLPYVLKCRRILKVEGYDGNVPLVRVVGIIQLVCGGEYGAIPLLCKVETLSALCVKYRTTNFMKYAPDHC